MQEEKESQVFTYLDLVGKVLDAGYKLSNYCANSR